MQSQYDTVDPWLTVTLKFEIRSSESTITCVATVTVRWKIQWNRRFVLSILTKHTTVPHRLGTVPAFTPCLLPCQESRMPGMGRRTVPIVAYGVREVVLQVCDCRFVGTGYLYYGIPYRYIPYVYGPTYKADSCYVRYTGTRFLRPQYGTVA